MMSRARTQTCGPPAGGGGLARAAIFRSACGVVLAILLCGAARADETEAEEPQEPERSTRSALQNPEILSRFSIHGFADVSFGAQRHELPGVPATTDDAFALGEVDLYIVSHLSDSLSFLAELVFELEEDAAVVDVERVFLRYAISDQIWLAGGRFHTPLGYWNPRFHHGLLLQPTIDRPLPVRFEDHGGVLPAHGVGLEAGGKVFWKDWSFDYTGGLFNGRGAEPTDVQNGSDLNSLKAPSVRLAFARGGPVDLEFGASYYADDIPPDPALPGRLDSMDEEILGAHLVLEGRRFDFFAEYFHMRHEDHASGARYRHPLYYALAMWTPWKWKPYAGYERVDLDESDPFFAGIEAERRTLLGVRFDPHPFVAVKAELRRDETSGERTDGLAVQIAYTF